MTEEIYQYPTMSLWCFPVPSFTDHTTNQALLAYFTNKLNEVWPLKGRAQYEVTELKDKPALFPLCLTVYGKKQRKTDTHQKTLELQFHSILQHHEPHAEMWEDKEGYTRM